jgi:cytochrome d ubiquinol oxidase subunit I
MNQSAVRGTLQSASQSLPDEHRRCEFWLKIFGVAFGLGVVSGVVMAFQFGTNWSELSRMSGPTQGPLLSYETLIGRHTFSAIAGVSFY